MPDPRPLPRASDKLPSADVMVDPLGWYEAWCVQQQSRRHAEDCLRDSLRRDVNWMSWFIVAWTALIVGSTVGVIWFVL